jgi:hypothetical protein
MLLLGPYVYLMLPSVSRRSFNPSSHDFVFFQVFFEKVERRRMRARHEKRNASATALKRSHKHRAEHGC